MKISLGNLDSPMRSLAWSGLHQGEHYEIMISDKGMSLVCEADHLDDVQKVFSESGIQFHSLDVLGQIKHKSHSADRTSMALEKLGMRGAGMSRDVEFFEEVSEEVNSTVRRIEALMGGDMPQEVKDIVYNVLEKAANMTGPQLVMTFSDEEAPSP